MKIREAHIEDAESISEIRRQKDVRETMLALTSERLGSAVDFLNGISEHGRAFVAEEDGKVIGMCAIARGRPLRRGHSAVLAVMVDSDYQRRGIGETLMKKALSEADNVLKLRRLELSVVTENKPAISLYEKLGFKIEATKKSSCIKDGRFADEYLMGRIRPEVE